MNYTHDPVSGKRKRFTVPWRMPVVFPRLLHSDDLSRGELIHTIVLGIEVDNRTGIITHKPWHEKTSFDGIFLHLYRT